MSDCESDFNTQYKGDQAFPVQSSALRVGGFVILGNFPCKIIEIATFNTGKHGRGKLRVTGIDIFEGSKHTGLFPSTARVLVPKVIQKEYQLVHIATDGFVTVLTDDLKLRGDFKLPTGLEEVRTKFKSEEVIMLRVIEYLDRSLVVGFKTSFEE